MKPLTSLSLREEHEYLRTLDVGGIRERYGEGAIAAVLGRHEALRRALSIYEETRSARDAGGAFHDLTLFAGKRVWTRRFHPDQIVELEVVSVSPTGRVTFAQPNRPRTSSGLLRETSSSAYNQVAVFASAEDALAAFRFERERALAFARTDLARAEDRLKFLQAANADALAAAEASSTTIVQPVIAPVVEEPAYPEVPADASEGERLVALLVTERLRADYLAAKEAAERTTETADGHTVGVGSRVYFFVEHAQDTVAPLRVRPGVIASIASSGSVVVAYDEERVACPIYANEHAALDALLAHLDTVITRTEAKVNELRDAVADAEADARTVDAIPVICFADPNSEDAP